MLKRILFLTLAFSMLASCRDTGIITVYDEIPPQSLFEENTEWGVYNGGIRVYQFSQDKHQINMNLTENVFTILADDFSSYVSVKFPSGELLSGDIIDISIASAGIPGIKDGVADVTVAKKSGDKLWLWDAEENRGYLINQKF